MTTATPIRVLVMSDVRLYREGLSQILAGEDRVSVASVTPRNAEGLHTAIADPTDIMLLDAALVRRPQIRSLIATTLPGSRVVVYGVSDDELEVVECAEAGVHGFVGREATPAQRRCA